MSYIAYLTLLTGGLALGIFFVVKGSDVFIDGAADIAGKLGVSESVIGLTLVAFATSLPELAVGLAAAFQNSTDIAFGTVIGSNVSNICLIIGFSALMIPLTISRDAAKHAVIMTMITILLFLFVLFDGVLSLAEGLVFIVIYIAFTWHLVGERGRTDIMKNKAGHENTWARNWSLVIFGALGVVFGARMLIWSATGIAREMGVSELVIGITVIAVGTSLPELASSITAAMKKFYGIAVGNVIGSNIINIVLVLGAASMIRPIPVSEKVIYITLPFTIAISAYTIFILERKMTKLVGVGLLAIYALFIAVLFLM